MKVNVLGAKYKILLVSKDDEPRLKDCDGFCDETTKELVVEKYKRGEPGSKGKLELQEKKNIRHEILHAFYLKAGWPKTAIGQSMRKWSTGLQNRLRNFLKHGGRRMHYDQGRGNTPIFESISSMLCGFFRTG